MITPLMSADQAMTYTAAHMGAAPDGLCAVMQADYGTVQPPPPPGDPPMNLDEARARFTAIQDECDRDGLRYTVLTWPTAPQVTWTHDQLWDWAQAEYRLHQDNLAFAADIQARLGVIWEHAAAGLDALKA